MSLKQGLVFWGFDVELIGGRREKPPVMDECNHLTLPSVRSSIDCYASWVATLVSFFRVSNANERALV